MRVDVEFSPRPEQEARRNVNHTPDQEIALLSLMRESTVSQGNCTVTYEYCGTTTPSPIRFQGDPGYPRIVKVGRKLAESASRDAVSRAGRFALGGTTSGGWRGGGKRNLGRIVVSRVVAVAAGLLIPLLALEALFRFAGPVLPGEYQTARLVAASELFGRQNMANRAGWKRSAEFSVQVRVNSKGLRGPEVAYEKAPGMFRVLVVGDSFTFGGQVEEDETFVVRLGHELQKAANRASSEPRQIETINAGVDGWNTANELAWLTSEGLRYEPDLVVLMFYTGNDPGENYDMLKAVKRVGVEMDPAAALPARDARRFLADTSALYAFLETGVISKLTSAPEASDLADLSEDTELRVRRSTDPDRQDQGWQVSGDLLRHLRVLCDDAGVQLLVVGIPTVEHVGNADRSPTPFTSIAEAAQAPALDLLIPFRSASAGIRDDLYYPKDRHWTPRGNDEAARHVAADLSGRGVLRQESSRR